VLDSSITDSGSGWSGADHLYQQPQAALGLLVTGAESQATGYAWLYDVSVFRSVTIIMLGRQGLTAD
jgi:hypothetical protein